LVSFEIGFLKILKKPSPLTNELEETKTGMMILNVDLEVLRKVGNALTQ
jgi:hypothetical protein